MEKIRLFAFAFWGHWLIGGSERRFLEMSRCFRNLGVDVYALEAFPTFRDMGINTRYNDLLEVKKFPRLRLLFMLLYLTPKALLFCRKNKCNLIYISHHYVFENVLSGFLVSCLLRKPFVVVFNGSLSPYFHSSFRSSLTYHRKKDGLISSLYFAFIDIFQTFVYRRANVCIAVSRSLAKEIKCQFNVKNLVVVGNGVNISEMSSHSFRRRKLYDAVFVGWLHPDKGVETLLKAWKVVVGKNPLSKLVIIGKPKTIALFKKYESMIEEYGLRNNVIMTGQIISRDVIAKFLNESRIFVLPSKSEGYGISVVEAMACSLPCVISDVPALRENFQDVAIFVRPDDAKGFAQAILSLLNDQEKSKLLGCKAYNHIKGFTWEKVSEREIRVLGFLLNSLKTRSKSA